MKNRLFGWNGCDGQGGHPARRGSRCCLPCSGALWPRWRLRCLLCGLGLSVVGLLGASVPARAAAPAASAAGTQMPIQSLAALQEAVRAFLREAHADGTGLDIEVSAIDPRLRLPACEAPLHTTWSPGSRRVGRVTVRVRCKGRKPWQLHVQGDVSREATVWKLARSAERGSVLEPSMVRREQVTLGRDRALLARSGTPIEDPANWFGHAFRQSVNTGQLLTDRLLEPPTLVHRGDRVRVVHRVRGLEVIGQGIAQSDGAINERLQVRNPRSGKIIDATVSAPGVVTLLR